MIRLQRTIEVCCFDVEGTVAFGRSRPEFLAVGRLAADLGRHITAKDISRELLAPLPPAVGRSVLDRCVHLGLLEYADSRGAARLTAAADLLLERNVVLSPEEGVFRFYYTDDPLVGGSLLHVVAIDTPEAKDERKALNGNGRVGRVERGDGTPTALAEAGEQPATSLATGELFQVQRVARQGARAMSEGLRLTLMWTPEALVRVQLEGRLSSPNRKAGIDVDAALEPVPVLTDSSYDDIWVALVNAATDVDIDTLLLWRGRVQESALPTSVADWPDAGRRTMVVDVPVPETRFEGMGDFEPTELSNVRLVPQSAVAAREWAEWLQWDDIDSYMMPARLIEIAVAARRRMAPWRPTLPKPAALLARAKASPSEATSRRLLAPSDLGLWR